MRQRNQELSLHAVQNKAPASYSPSLSTTHSLSLSPYLFISLTLRFLLFILRYSLLLIACYICLSLSPMISIFEFHYYYFPFLLSLLVFLTLFLPSLHLHTQSYLQLPSLNLFFQCTHSPLSYPWAPSLSFSLSLSFSPPLSLSSKKAQSHALSLQTHLNVYLAGTKGCRLNQTRACRVPSKQDYFLFEDKKED